jgi:hypothetical protein
MIISDFHFFTKMANPMIYHDNTTLKVEGKMICGSHNTIYGKNTCYGNDNKVYGDGSKIYGNKNTYFGNKIVIDGDGNTGSGQNCCITGRGNIHQGSVIKLKGSGNYVDGDVVNVDGQDNQVTGKCGNNGINVDQATEKCGDNSIIIQNMQYENGSTIKQTIHVGKNAHIGCIIGSVGLVDIASLPEKEEKKEIKFPSEDKDIVAPENTDQQKICVVCTERLRNIAFSPCGHVACCIKCTKQLISKPCPLCRKTVENILQVFL